jgi:hypothetical protein
LQINNKIHKKFEAITSFKNHLLFWKIMGLEQDKRIVDFLYHTMGYAKVDEIMQQEHPGSQKHQAFLNGTIIGTCATTNYDEGDRYGGEYAARHRWKMKFKIAPHIYTADQLEERAQDTWHLQEHPPPLVASKRLKGIRKGISCRQYFLSSGIAFEKHTMTMVKEQWFDRIHDEQFPEARIDFKSAPNFRIAFEVPDFYLNINGSRDRRKTKVVAAAFNLPQETVDEINEIARKYNNHMSTIEHIRKVKGKQPS